MVTVPRWHSEPAAGRFCITEGHRRHTSCSTQARSIASSGGQSRRHSGDARSWPSTMGERRQLGQGCPPQQFLKPP